MEALCKDCGVNIKAIGEMAMLLNEVWAATGLSDLGDFLCLGCIESRLGRRLEPKDFSVCILNAGWPPHLTNSPRLKDRLGGRFSLPPLSWLDLFRYSEGRTVTPAMREWLEVHKPHWIDNA